MAFWIFRKQQVYKGSVKVVTGFKFFRDPDNFVMRETNIKNIRLYWKSLAEMFIPLSLYESTKNLENQIFEAISLEDMRNMMKQYAFL